MRTRILPPEVRPQPEASPGWRIRAAICSDDVGSFMRGAPCLPLSGAWAFEPKSWPPTRRGGSLPGSSFTPLLASGPPGVAGSALPSQERPQAYHNLPIIGKDVRNVGARTSESLLLLLDLPLQQLQDASFVGRQVLVVQESFRGLQPGRIVPCSPAVLADPADYSTLRLAEQPVVTATDGTPLNHHGTSLFRTRRPLSRLPP